MLTTEKFIIGLIIVIVTMLWCTNTIINHIEKHSVHPEHGNFEEVSFQRPCSPWDSC